MSDDGVRYCFAAEDGELVEKKKLVDYELLGMVHFPTINEMVTYSQKGDLIQWRTLIVCYIVHVCSWIWFPLVE